MIVDAATRIQTPSHHFHMADVALCNSALSAYRLFQQLAVVVLLWRQCDLYGLHGAWICWSDWTFFHHPSNVNPNMNVRVLMKSTERV